MSSLSSRLGPVFFLIALASPAHASAWAGAEHDYFTIDTIETSLVGDETGVEFLAPDETLAPQSRLSLTEIINMGKQAWKVVVANAPVVNVKIDNASAVPKGATDWQDLAGWQAPKARVFRVAMKNRMGLTVVDFAYRVLYTPGGQYRGHGRYLTHVTTAVENLSVAWAYNFEAEVTVPSVINAGTDAEPIGAAELLIAWKVKTPVKEIRSSQSYYVRGTGEFAIPGGRDALRVRVIR